MDHMVWVMDRICVAVILPKVAEENSGAATLVLPKVTCGAEAVILLTTTLVTAGVLLKETATLITTTGTAIVCSAMGLGCGSTGRITTRMATIVIGC
jgi:hypothetical protein